MSGWTCSECKLQAEWGKSISVNWKSGSGKVKRARWSLQRQAVAIWKQGCSVIGTGDGGTGRKGNSFGGIER